MVVNHRSFIHLFSPKKGLQAFFFASLFLSLQVILIWLIETLFIISFLLTFFLPMMAMFIMYFTPRKTIMTYFVASVFIPFFVSPNPIQSILFLLLPNLVLGAMMGQTFKLKMPLHHIFFILSCVHYLMMYVTIGLLDLFFSTPLLTLFFENPIFRGDLSLFLTASPFVLYSISIGTVLLTLFLFFPIIERFHISVNYDFRPKVTHLHALLILLSLHFVIFFLWPSISFFLLGPIVLLTAYLITYYLFNQQSRMRYVLLASFALFPLLNGIINPLIERPYQLNGVVIMSWFTAIIILMNSLSKSVKIKIK